MGEFLWTPEKIIDLSQKYKSPSELKKAYPGAYRNLRRFKLTQVLYPLDQRQRQSKFDYHSLQKLISEKNYRFRVDLQQGNPSAYNAARKLKLLDHFFAAPRNKKKWNKESLKKEASQFKTRKEFYDQSPGAHSVACKLKLLDEICPPIMQGNSIAELEILEFLKGLSSDFCTKRFANDFELDCYSELKQMGIEYNGLFWHSEKNRSSRYHLDKTLYFEKRGIRIIHIWEHEWRDRKIQTMNFLSSACGGNQNKIGARKCEFKEISWAQAKAFLKETHIQGAPSHAILSLGIFHKEELLGVCTFGKHHRQNGRTHAVLNRMAFRRGFTIQGAVQKFSKMGFEKLGPLQSWADRDKSQANGYLKAHWKIEKILRPDYFYILPGAPAKVISKQARRKKAVHTPEDMTEHEHALKDGLLRVWNCGKILLTYPS